MEVIECCLMFKNSFLGFVARRAALIISSDLLHITQAWDKYFYMRVNVHSAFIY